MCKNDDETYWHELMTKKEDIQQKAEASVLEFNRQNLPNTGEAVEIDLEQKPFERFMNRVEKYDISGDEK